MKLLVCKKCNYIFSLWFEERTCKCGKSGGLYVDELYAEIWGPSIPIGFANSSFIPALKEGMNVKGPAWGIDFKAFVIPMPCDTIKRKDED